MSSTDFDDARKRRQLELARQEREQSAQKKRDIAAATKRSREPHGQAGMTPIEKRIIARAEAHMKIRAAIAAGDYSGGLKPKPTATVRARWDKAVESAGAECGGNRARAVAMVAKQFPKLREDLIAEANRR